MKCEFNQKFSIDIFQNLEQKHAAIRWLNTCFDDIFNLRVVIPNDSGYRFPIYFVLTSYVNMYAYCHDP